MKAKRVFYMGQEKAKEKFNKYKKNKSERLCFSKYHKIEMDLLIMETESAKIKIAKMTNMKRFLIFIFSLIVFSLVVEPMPIQAASAHVFDDADLLTAEEEKAIDQKASQIAQDYDIDVLVLTTYEIGSSDVYARDFIESYGEQYHADGYIGYCIDMSDRSFWVDGYGENALKYFDQSDTDAISNDVEDYLADEEFGESASAFLNGVDHHLAKATKKYGFFTNIIINKTPYMIVSIFGVLFGILVAGMMTYSKMHLHQDKKIKRKADEYSDPVQLDEKNEQLIRTYQTRTPVPKAQNNGGGYSGGGGGGHVGSGGHF